MRDIYNIDKEDLLNFMIEKLRNSRGLFLTTKEVTEEYFGKPNSYDYTDLFFFSIATRIVGHAWKHLRNKTKLHVYRVKKGDSNGIIVLEDKKDFNQVIERKKRRIENLRVEVTQLEKDKASERYKQRVSNFFKRKVSTNEFNSIAKERLNSTIKIRKMSFPKVR